MKDNINKILKHTLIFLVVFLITNQLLTSCQNKEEEIAKNNGNIIFTTTDNEFTRTSKVTVKIDNQSAEKIIIQNECPNEPFNVFKFEYNEWIPKTNAPEMDCSEAKDYTIESGESQKITYDNWNYALFSEMGRFKITYDTTLNGKNTTLTTNEFLITEEGFFKKITLGLFYKPIYNALIFIVMMLPGHHLLFAIILLTLIIRTILLIPSQKAMRSQKRMQELQPKLDKIKKKHKGDQQRISMETMALWKESKVNPLSSCLPMLMQFPFLIALYYVIQGGLNPDNTHLLYTTYSSTLQDINVNSFNIIDLTKPNIYVLPFVVGGLQFLQLKLVNLKKENKKNKKTNKSEKKDETQAAMKMMTYFMPIMIAVFTASVPAGVGIYWGTSTLYAIIQQIIVNNEKDKIEKIKPNRDEVKIKVIKTKSVDTTDNQ